MFGDSVEVDVKESIAKTSEKETGRDRKAEYRWGEESVSRRRRPKGR